MKFHIFVFVALFAAAQAVPFMEQVEQYKDVCIKETNIDASKIPSRPPGPPSGPPPSGPPPEPDHDMKCFMNCLMEKGGIVNAAGELQTDKVPLPPGVTGVNLDSCKSVSASDKCERAWMMTHCIMQQLPRRPAA